MGKGVPRQGKVTIRHVAEDAGVSVAAVSKVMRNAYGVSDALRDKVLKSIDSLGYRPSHAARGMRGRTFAIGILLVDMRNPFLPSIVEGVKEVMTAASYQVLVGVGEGQTTIESSLIESMIDMKMDGVLLVAPRLSGASLDPYAAQIPMVVVGHHEPAAAGFDTINSDDRLGARLAVEALIASGRREIHMTSLEHRNGAHDVYVQRERGYLDAMEDAGLSDRARIWALWERPGRRGLPLSSLFESDPLPEGVFCWSDIHAIRLLNEAKMRGIDVPGRLAIVGYDNTPAADLPLIGLSSVDQRGAELGRRAGDALLTRIGGRTEPAHLLIRPELIRRTSG